MNSSQEKNSVETNFFDLDPKNKHTLLTIKKTEFDGIPNSVLDLNESNFLVQIRPHPFIH